MLTAVIMLAYCSACVSNSGMIYDIKADSGNQFSLMKQEYKGEFDRYFVDISTETSLFLLIIA